MDKSNPWERSERDNDVREVKSRYTGGAYPSSMHLMAAKGFCLCLHPCKRFKPGTAENCPRAQALYKLCCDHNLVTPVAQCEEFEDGHENT